MQRFWYKRLLTRLDKGLLEGVFQDSKEKVEVEEIEAVGDGVAHTGDHLTLADELEDLGDDQWKETRQIVEQVVQDSTSTDGKWRKLMNLLMQLRKVCDFRLLMYS